MTDATLDALLAMRAQAQDVVDVDQPRVMLVVFDLAGRRFALRGSVVREILADAEICPLPSCPAALAGVTRVRGDIESVLRLDVLLQLDGPAESGHETCLLIAQGSRLRSAVQVAGVRDVLDVAEGQILPPPGSAPETLRPFLQGVITLDDVPVSVLDLDRLFDAFAGALP